MHTNKHYFEYSKMHPEPMFDPYYAKNMVVIPSTPKEQNQLTQNNSKLMDLITAFQVAIAMGKGAQDKLVQDIIVEIDQIVMTTKNIHFSPFCQFFMVQNSNYNAYKTLSPDNRLGFLYEMLMHYCSERHDMYKSYGYSDMVLQVMCDSYSHKRNSNTSIKKFISMLAPYEVRELTNPQDIITEDNYYFLPDKTGRECFDCLLLELEIKMESRVIEHNKRPDIVFKHAGNYYIFELKMMKGGGGGQNKQAVEFAYFIKFSELNQNVHYGILLDSLYANELLSSSQPKIVAQRDDVIRALENNPQNYFVNTAGGELLLHDIFC